MTKAVLFPLGLVFLLAATGVSSAQNNPAVTIAVNEAVMRQADTILLRQKLEAAKTAVAQNDLVNAAKLYEEALQYVQKIGSGIDAERAQTISGLVSVRYELAREAQRRGDLHEADTEIGRVLKVDPQNQDALAFKKQNDALMAQMRGRMPDVATQEQVPAIINDKTEAATLVRDGQLLYQMGKLEEAEAKLKQAMQLDSNNQGAYYFMNLVKQARYDREEHKHDIDTADRMVQVATAQESPVHRELLPEPNPYATTNLIHTGVGREAIYSKLDRIHLDTVNYDGLPLSEVVRNLTEQTKLRDPDKKGINFLINPNADTSAAATPTTPGPGGGATTVNPATGLPESTPSPSGGEAVDINSVSIKLALNDVRLADVLDAIVLVADHPIKYSVEDYAIVFSSKGPATAQLEMRSFRVDPNTFYSGLQNVSAFSFGSANVQSSSGGGSSGGGGGGGGSGGSGTFNGAVVPVVDVAPGSSGIRSSSGGGSSGGGAGAAGGTAGEGALITSPFESRNGGVLYVTSPNQTRDVSAVAKSFFTSLGVNLDPPKSLFFNDRLGVLFVYASPEDLDIIERAIQTLNQVPPMVHIKARFIDVEQDDSKALGFDWYLGQINMGNVAATAGNAGSVNVPTSAANPSGIFPGNNFNGTALPATVQSLTSGLNNSSIPAIATITGILTNPNFQVVLHALESRQGTEELAEPEVTTISGRQTQMRATEILTIVTGFNFQQGQAATTSTGTAP